MRISNIQLQVRDTARSMAFYCDLFGMEEAPERIPNGRVRECTFRSGNSDAFTLTFAQAFHEPTTAPLEHISFEVGGIEELFELYGRAAQLGARSLQPRLRDGWWCACIFDPDGHKLEVIARAAAASDVPSAQAV